MQVHDQPQKHHPKTLTMMANYHTPHLSSDQCGSNLVQIISSPLLPVWSMVRSFDNPQAYKQFIKSCNMCSGDGGVGSVREVMVVSGLPAETSLERLDMLDDGLHVMVVSFIGGDHRLLNYRATTTLHEIEDDGGDRKTVVIESYVVDVPSDSCKEDTCFFANTIIGCNLRSLARIAENMAPPL